MLPTSVFSRENWRRRLASENETVTRRLQAAYARILPALQREAGRLIDALEQKRLMTPEDFQQLVNAVRFEMDAFAGVLRNEVAEAQAAGIVTGTRMALDLAERSAGVGAPLVRLNWNRVKPEALATLINYVDGEAMRQRLRAFGDDAAQSLSDVILAGVAQGRNPRAMATLINVWLAVPYSWAENMTRTAHIWSLRSAAHLTYKANPEIVTGWIWSASLDNRTCISCWAQHGRKFSTDQVLNDHHRGRCAPLPIVRGTRWADAYQTGEQRFRQLPASQQRAIMGKKLYDAWRAGRASFEDFSRPYNDGVYGEMLRAATLQEIVANVRHKP